MLQRSLFRWKLQQWSDLLYSLREFIVCDKLKDSLIWKGAPSGKYSTKLYCKSVLHVASTDMEIWKLVWVGLTPPKMEAFCWQLMRGRITTTEQLASRGLLNWNVVVCTFCKSDKESISHLFFSCYFS